MALSSTVAKKWLRTVGSVDKMFSWMQETRIGGKVPLKMSGSSVIVLLVIIATGGVV